MRLPLLSRLPRLHLVCWVLSVSWLKRNPPRLPLEDTSTNPRRNQLHLLGNCTFWPRPEECANRNIFKIRRCKSGLFPFNQPKFHFSPYLLYLNIVLVSNYEVHWWVSDRRVRHETVCMDKRIKCCQNVFCWSEHNFSFGNISSKFNDKLSASVEVIHYKALITRFRQEQSIFYVRK